VTRQGHAPDTGRSRRNQVARVSAYTAGIAVLLLAVVVVVLSERMNEPAEEAVLDQDPAPTEVVVQRVRGDTYIEADLGYPRSLNPLLAHSLSERNLSKLLFRGLVEIDGSGMPEPDLAHEWSISDDGTLYTVRLDPDARWHDGEPLVAADVLFTISLTQDPGFPGHFDTGRFWRGVTATKIDDETVEFRLLEPFAGFINHLTLPILPRHILSGTLASDLPSADFNWEPIGTGAYRFSAADEGAGEIRLVAAIADTAPAIENLVFRYFDDLNEMLAAFRNGDVLGMSYVPFEAVQQPELLPSDATVFAPSMPGYTALYFNLRHPLFRDEGVRQAIEHAIDRGVIVEEVLGGQASPGSSPIPAPLWYYVPGDHRAHDVDESRRRLEALGWRPSDADGVLEAEGQRFSFPLVVNADDPQRLAVALAIQEQLSVVGIAVDVQAMSIGEVNEALGSRQFAAALYGWHAANGDPDCYQMWHSSQADEGLNITGFSDHQVDELLAEARRTADPEERRRLYGEFQDYFAEQVPAVVLYYPRYHFAVSSAVHGVQLTPLVDPSYRVRQISEWYVEIDGAEEESG
jgi:peptide/nickel transport system substrate-binding protein